MHNYTNGQYERQYEKTFPTSKISNFTIVPLKFLLGSYEFSLSDFIDQYIVYRIVSTLEEIEIRANRVWQTTVNKMDSNLADCT